MTKKVEELANRLGQCDRETVKALASAFSVFQPRWVLMPWDAVYGSNRASAIVSTAPIEATTEYTVLISGFDAAKKVGIIREVRAITGLGLVESKTLVETPNGVIKADVGKDEAERIRAQLVAAGAVIEVK
jgi:large subunit ribosomal protein L7/L12